MVYFAIQHIPSGKFLPQLRKRRGHTHTEPEALTDAVPRLHLTVKGAKVALAYWLMGKGSESFASGSFDIPPGEYDGNDFTPQPDRKREDMRIVKVSLRPEVK